MALRPLLRIVTAMLLPVLTLTGSERGLMVVHRKDAGSWVLEWRGKDYRCAVGRNGVAREGEKREGDGKTPSGTFALRGLYFRPDKVHRDALPDSLKPVALTTEDGWCDEPGDPQYNRFVRLPFAASHESLWRANDDLYDIIIPIGYNDDPVIPGMGSAIFVHVARGNYAPTAGCVTLSRRDLVEILRTLRIGVRIRISPE